MKTSTKFRFGAVIGAVTGVLGCALSAGCSGDGAIQQLAPSDTVEVEVEADTGVWMPLRSEAADTVIMARKTPLLTKRIDSMTNVEVGNYLRTLAYRRGTYSTQEATVPCVHADTTPCASSDSAHVIIQPEAGMNRWNFDSIPPTGLVVARIINDAPAGRYAHNFKYPPQRKTWWVVDDSAGNLRSRYFTRTYSNVGPAITFVTDTRTFTKCAHPDAPAGRPARAKFWDCAQSAVDTLPVSLSRPFRGAPSRVRGERLAARPVVLVSSVPLPPAPAPYMLTSNWVTCDAGCCASQ
jgi:hypothetical protein